MLKKIKYSYIPKTKVVNSVLTSLYYCKQNFDDPYDVDFIVIENISNGLRFYPDELENKIIRSKKEDLIININKTIEQNDIQLLLINGYDLDLDYIKNELLPIAINKEIGIAVNIIKDNLNNEDILSVMIQDKTINYTNEEWEKAKKEIESILNEQCDETYDEKEYLDIDIDSLTTFKDLLDHIDISGKEIESYLDEKYNFDMEEDIIIEEEYIYKTKEKETKISLLKDKDIIIEKDGDFVLIEKECIDFIFNSLKLILKR